MDKSYFKRVAQFTQTKFWINNVTPEEAQLAIDNGAVGCTQNPSYTYKMLVHPKGKEHALELLDKALDQSDDDNQVQVILQRELVKEVAKVFLPIYEASKGKRGYVSIQGDPIQEDEKTITDHAIFNREAGVNIMAKIPAIPEGLNAIRTLLPQGCPVNVTEIMGMAQVRDVVELYAEAEKKISSVPVTCYSVITGIFDEYLNNYVVGKKINISHDILWQAGMVVAKKAYEYVKNRGSAIEYIGGGARGLHHFTEMVGADANITINWVGTAENLIKENPLVVERFRMPTPEYVLDELLEKVDEFKKAFMINELQPEEYEDYGPVVLFRDSFVTAWTKANDIIAERRKTR